MILNKYNEIMSKVTVDPEMKSRIMSAVSQAIKDQAENPSDTDDSNGEGTSKVTDLTNVFVNASKDTETSKNAEEKGAEEKPVRRKAKVIPVAVISSIAAAVLVLIGAVWFISHYLDGAKAASTTVAEHNSKANDVASEIDSVLGGDKAPTEANADTQPGADVSEETTTSAADNKNLSQGGNKNYATITNDNRVIDSTKLPGEKEDVDYSQGIGNERIDKISRKLPFDLKSTGSGTYTDGSLKEVFIGENDEKVIVVTTYEGTDVLKKVFPNNKSVAVAGQTPGGISVELYYVAFGNVPKLGKGETTTSVNAAVFMKNGYKYLIVYSEIVAPEVIYDLVDVI